MFHFVFAKWNANQRRSRITGSPHKDCRCRQFLLSETAFPYIDPGLVLYINERMENRKNISDRLQGLFASLEDTPEDGELKEKILSTIVEFARNDVNLLDSALESVFQTFGGQELYPTKEEKGARLGFTLISNHAFVDGNKRIGMYVMLTFLEVNGIRIEATNDEVADVGLKVASGEMSYESLLDWVRSHRVY